jgi:hypothetical protein
MKIHKLVLTSALYASAPKFSCSQTINISNEIRLGNSIAQFVSGASGLDGPKMDPEINATSFDWWYFDAVSENNSCAVVIVFYMSTDLGFPFVLPLSTLSVDIFATFEDGTLVFLPLNDLPLSAGTATVVTDGDGSSGIWEGTGFEWKGAPDLSQYVVTIDSPLLDITGTLSLNSVCIKLLSYNSSRIITNCSFHCPRLLQRTIHVAQTRPTRIWRFHLTSGGQMLYLTQMQ